MKVLVTGDKGYIGRILVKHLISKGYEVVGMDIDYYKGCDLYEDQLPEYKSIEKDIREVTKEDLEGIDCIHHLAALSNDPLGEKDPGVTMEINYEASLKLSTLAKKAGVMRFVYSSSCSMYGKAGANTVNEESPLEPLTAYAQSKVKSEAEISKLADKMFTPVFLRNSTVYGLSPRLRFDLVVNNLVGSAFTTGKIKIMSDGTPWRPLIHIEDLAEVFFLVTECEKDVVHNQAFNVGENTENYQIKDIAEIVKKVMPECEITYTYEHGPDTRSYRVNFDKLHTSLKGFKCRKRVEDGVKELYAKFKEVGLTYEDFMSYKFTRLKNIRRLMEAGKLDKRLHWQVI
ncbi:MAG: SDR family oxidoreductase [Thermoplasmata archaeon]